MKSPGSNYALVGGSVFDSRSAQLLQNRALWVEGKRIRMVCDCADLPSDLPRVDIAGKTILPGMIDVHVHSEEWHAPLYLAKGITTVRDVGCELESILDRRTRWNADDTTAPRLVCTGPLLDGPGNAWQPMTQLVQTPEEARAKVDYFVDRDVDQIKAYAFLNWECFSAIVDQAHRRGKFVVAHLGKHTDARRAIRAGLDEVEHLSGIGEAMRSKHNASSPTWDWMKYWATVDADRMQRMIDLILERGTWIAITRLVWQRLATLWDSRNWTHPQINYVPRPLRTFWEIRFPADMPSAVRRQRRQQIAGMAIFTTELIRSGAKILIGTDCPFPHLLPGFSYHDELHSLLDCGMSESAALQAATLSGARALQIDHLVGAIELGKAADLLIVNGDPTADLQALQHVAVIIQKGRWLNPDDLLVRAAEYALAAQPSEQRRFDANY